MIVHHHDAVLPLERGLGGANPYAGRICALVAQNRQPQLLLGFPKIGMTLIRKGSGKLFLPDPFYFILRIAEIGYVVRTMTGCDAIHATDRAF